MPITYRKIFIEETEEELMQMTRKEAMLDLNEKQRRFCEEYVKNHNVILAAKKAGYAHTAAHTLGWKLRQKPEINRYIAWLKLRIANTCHVNALDIIDQYIRIAFADITDFVEIKDGKIKVINSDMIDGQLVTEVRRGRDGITIKLADKLAALDKLERYFDVMPKDWKQKIEEKKLQLMEQKLELEKLKAGQISEENVDDGFLEALKASAEEVWEDDENDNE